MFETIGSIDEFQAAVGRVKGLEWLVDLESDPVEPDEDFYSDDEHRDKPLDRRLFLTSIDRRGLEGIERLWEQYKSSQGKDLPWNFAKWRDLFAQLRQVRFWDTQDRLRDTGLLENLRFEIEHARESVRIEAELWFHQNPTKRAARANHLRLQIDQDGGQVLAEREIEGAGYHGMLFELPAAAASKLLDGSYDLLLLRDSAVMFFRPTGQTTFAISVDEPIDAPTNPLPESASDQDPVVALLDGLPLANHQWLANRVIVDDPDGWESAYPANLRAHGTAMASLIVRGAGGRDGESLSRPIYARAVMRPKPTWSGQYDEAIPDDQLPLDLIHRAFRRMFEPEDGSAPAAPNVRIVNFSIGDKARPFDRSVSSWARLFDWLSWHYNVLVLVSTGNSAEEIALDIPSTDMANVEPADLERRVIEAIAKSAALRRMLVPAEAINALTIGALHHDGTVIDSLNDRLGCYVTPGMPSPVNRLGLGFRRSIKPEILLPGGRQLYRRNLGSTHQQEILQIAAGESRPPGQPVAAPGLRPGELTGMLYKRGTSNATALASRAAAQILETLQDLRTGPGGEVLLDECIPATLKALLVHGARWTEGHEALKKTLVAEIPALGSALAERFVGYGQVDLSRAQTCTDQRATVLGCGIFDAEGAHQFSFPLPESLSGRRDLRRLVVTLAWLTPINPRRQTYRMAALSFGPTAKQLKDLVGVKSRDANGNAAKRGTVQHQVFAGQAVRDFADGAEIVIQVDCREEAGPLNGQRVPYAIIVSLEVAESLDISIYDEIFQRIRQPIQITPRGG